MYWSLSVYQWWFLCVWVWDEVWEQHQWRRFFSNEDTENKMINYVVIFKNFFVRSSMFFVSRGNLYFEGLDFIDSVLYVFEVVVHFDILEKCKPEVLVCWHGLNFKYLFLLISIHIMSINFILLIPLFSNFNSFQFYSHQKISNHKFIK